MSKILMQRVNKSCLVPSFLAVNVEVQNVYTVVVAIKFYEVDQNKIFTRSAPLMF